LPSFIENADNLRKKGVDAIYCLSVNDKFVMKEWGKATEGCLKSGIILVADGNANFTKALNLVLGLIF
jgi:peroxiredoxin